MASARISRGNLIFVSLVLLGVAALVAIVLIDRPTGLQYTVMFEDADNLPVGAPVRMQGIQIGEVTGVRLSDRQPGMVEVDLKIHAPHRRRIHEAPNTSARIKKDSMVLGQPYVEVLNRGDLGAGLQAGSVVQGVDGWTQEKLWLAGGAMGEAYEKALTVGREHLDRLEEWATEGEGARKKEEVLAYLQSLEEAAGTRAGAARERLSAAMERGRELWRGLREEKAPEAAEQVRQSLEALLEQGESLEEGAREQLERLLEEIDAEAADEETTPTAAQ